MKSRREISREYKERRLRGGVYVITNTTNGKYLLGHTTDVAGLRHRYDFAVTTGSAMHPKLREDWNALGGEAFRLDVLEELEQGPEQSQAEFVEDLKTLEQLKRADLDASKEY